MYLKNISKHTLNGLFWGVDTKRCSRPVGVLIDRAVNTLSLLSVEESRTGFVTISSSVWEVTSTVRFLIFCLNKKENWLICCQICLKWSLMNLVSILQICLIQLVILLDLNYTTFWQYWRYKTINAILTCNKIV